MTPYDALNIIRRIVFPRFDDPETEAEFRSAHNTSIRRRVRTSAIVATVITLTFINYDFIAWGAYFWISMSVRLIGVCTPLLVLSIFTYSNEYDKRAELINSLGSVTSCLGVQLLTVALYAGPNTVMDIGQACITIILAIVFATISFQTSAFTTAINSILSVIIFAIIEVNVFKIGGSLAAAYVLDLSSTAILCVMFSQQQAKAYRENFSLSKTVQGEKLETERLLYDLVPESAIMLLKAGRPVVDTYSNASVIFCDLVAFTNLAGRVAPGHLIDILDAVFERMDRAASENSVEKVKTIGDGYMAIVTERHSTTPAVSAIQFGLDVVAELEKWSRERGLEICARVGIHNGFVIGGVIGKRRFVYDYWGDTVNIASRMESSGAPGRVHVSEATYLEALREFDFEPRGIIEVKGRGEMKTFFATRRRHHEVS